MDEDKINTTGEETNNPSNKSVMDDMKNSNHSNFKIKIKKSGATSKIGRKIITRGLALLFAFVLAIEIVVGPFYAIINSEQRLTSTNMGRTVANVDSSSFSTLARMWQGIGKLWTR